jgi:FixJ family two-component response regulator
LDLYLNGINGLDVYRALEERGFREKVVFISGCDEKSEIFGKAMELKVPLVVKTFDTNALRQSMIDGTVAAWANDQLTSRGIKPVNF